MGRSSLPLLNRSGKYMRWQNFWDDKKYFSIQFEEDIFLSVFIKFFFSKYLFFFTQNLLFFKKHISLLFYITEFAQFSEISELLTYLDLISQKRKSQIKLFTLQFNILKFQQNIVVCIKLYKPLRIKRKKIFFDPETKSPIERNNQQFQCFFLLLNLLKKNPIFTDLTENF